MKKGVLICLLMVCWGFLAGQVDSMQVDGAYYKQQLQDSSRNSIQVGVIRNATEPFTDLTVTAERGLRANFSILATAGMNPIRVPNDYAGNYRLFWHVSLEGRYYYALRRERLLSGFFAGLFLSYDVLGYHFRKSHQAQGKVYLKTLGMTLGYQHVFGKRVCLSGGIIPAYMAPTIEERYDRAGRLLGGMVWPATYSGFVFIRVGFKL